MLMPGTLTKSYGKRSMRRDGPFGFRAHAIIYAIEAPELARIKIGRTLDIKKRFDSLASSSPARLILLGHCWMPEDSEGYLHDHLRDDRSHGEWFLATTKVRAIATMIATELVVDLCKEIGMGFLRETNYPAASAR